MLGRKIDLGTILIAILVLAAAIFLWLRSTETTSLPAASTSTSAPDAVDAGTELCAAAKATRDIVDCTLQGWGKTVDIRMDTTAAQAREICAGLAARMMGRGFAGKGWTLRILSPYSGEQPIAKCALR